MHIHLHLPNILMLEFADFQVKEDKAAQQPVIEDQIHHEMLFVKGKAFLPPDKGKACSQLQEKLL